VDNLSKPVKILIGLLTIWPFIWIFIFCLAMFGMVFIASGQSGHGGDDMFPVWFFALMIPHVLTILLWNGLMMFYIVHVILTKRIAENNTKAVWGVLLYLFNILVMAVYWYLYIWSEPRPAETASNAT
jgi:hypothetical protein